jgi:hypothetical protein
MWQKLDPAKLIDVDTNKPITFQTHPISFLTRLSAFPMIQKLGLIVLGIPFGSVENERLWKVMSKVESKKRPRLKVLQSSDQVFLRNVWKNTAGVSELKAVHAPFCVCDDCKRQ